MNCTVLNNASASINDIDNTTNLKNMKQIKIQSYQYDSSYQNEYDNNSSLDLLFDNNLNKFEYGKLFRFDNVSIITTFNKPEKIKGIFLILNTNNGIYLTIYGSNDNKNFTQLDKSSKITCGGYGNVGSCEVILDNTNKYKYYKFILKEAWNASECLIWLYTNLIDKYCIKNNDGYYNIINNKKVESNFKEDTNMIDSLPNNKINSNIKIVKVSKEYKIV